VGQRHPSNFANPNARNSLNDTLSLLAGGSGGQADGCEKAWQIQLREVAMIIFVGDSQQIPKFTLQVTPNGQEEPRCRDAASNERREIKDGVKD
jgi:hypothetical protein